MQGKLVGTGEAPVTSRLVRGSVFGAVLQAWCGAKTLDLLPGKTWETKRLLNSPLVCVNS